MDGAPRLRSVQGLPQLSKMAPLDLSFDDQPSHAKSTLQDENLLESPVCLEDLSNFDGHVHEERLSSENLSSIDGHTHMQPILPREMEESNNFTTQESGDDVRTKVDSGVGPNRFPPPPVSEVMKYSRKPLPSPPSPTQKNREGAVERMVQSVPVSKPTVYLQAERPRSYAASIHVAVQDDGLEELPSATNQTSPVPMTWLSRVSRRDTWDQKCLLEDRTPANLKR
jgi:hypothetical protein